MWKMSVVTGTDNARASNKGVTNLVMRSIILSQRSVRFLDNLFIYSYLSILSYLLLDIGLSC